MEKFSLDVVDADKQADGKVVGTCDGGTKKIVYKRDLAARFLRSKQPGRSRGLRCEQ